MTREHKYVHRSEGLLASDPRSCQKSMLRPTSLVVQTGRIGGFLALDRKPIHQGCDLKIRMQSQDTDLGLAVSKDFSFGFIELYTVLSLPFSGPAPMGSGVTSRVFWCSESCSLAATRLIHLYPIATWPEILD